MYILRKKRCQPVSSGQEIYARRLGVHQLVVGLEDDSLVLLSDLVLVHPVLVITQVVLVELVGV